MGDAMNRDMVTEAEAEAFGQALRRDRFERTGRGATFDADVPLTSQEFADGYAAARFARAQSPDPATVALQEEVASVRHWLDVERASSHAIPLGAIMKIVAALSAPEEGSND